MKANSKASLWKVLLFNLALLLAGVVGIELYFGNWLNSQNLNFLNIIRDQVYYFDASEIYEGDREVTYRRDRWGLRGPYLSPSDIDIMTIGGSTTDQRYLTEGKTWQDILSKKFLNTGENVTIANAGVDGQSTLGHIKNFQLWFPHIPNLKVKYFLYYVGINDYRQPEGYGDDVLSHHDDNIKIVKRSRDTKTFVYENSALIYLFRTIYGLYLAKDINHHMIGRNDIPYEKCPSFAPGRPEGDKRYKDSMKGSLRSYEKRLNLLFDATQKLGSQVICVTQPSWHHKWENGAFFISSPEIYSQLKVTNDKLVEVCQKREAIVIDMARELTNLTQNDYYDCIHNTPQGASKVGSYLYKKLKPLFTNRREEI